MSIVLQSTGGGQITIQEPTTASNFTQTLPAATGNVMVSGNMPAFSAYPNTPQTINATTNTKVTLTAKNFDTANCFDSTTNYRFTPTVAGYYQINGSVMLAGTSGYCYAIIYKNGSEWLRGAQATAQTNSYPVSSTSSVIYFNGTTDYVELYAWFSATVGDGSLNNYTQFSGSLVRAA